MFFDDFFLFNWIARTGEGLSIAALLYGAYLALMETEPFCSLFGKNSAAPFSLSPKEVRLIEGLPRCASDTLSQLGNAQVDMQHQVLADTTNNLRDAILSGRSSDEISALLETLIRDLGQHFQDEEATLAATAHPATENHAQQHRQLLNGASSRLGQFRAGTLGIGELFKYLSCDVFAKHMLGADRELVP